MPDEEFFRRLNCEFAAHHALAVEAAQHDELAERHIAKAEYEIIQAHRALRRVMQGAQVAQTDAPLDAAPAAQPSKAVVNTPAQADDAVAA